MELLTLIGSYAGSIMTIIGLLTLIIKPLRERLIKWIGKTTDRDMINEKLDDLTSLVEKSISQNEELKAEMSKQSEALKADLRNSILEIYYECLSKKSITDYEIRNLTELYDNYKALGGNSFIHDCIERLKQFETINDRE